MDNKFITLPFIFRSLLNGNIELFCILDGDTTCMNVVGVGCVVVVVVVPSSLAVDTVVESNNGMVQSPPTHSTTECEVGKF